MSEPLTLEGVAGAMFGLEEAVRHFSATLGNKLTTRDEMVESTLSRLDERMATVERTLREFLTRVGDLNEALRLAQGRVGPQGFQGHSGTPGFQGHPGTIGHVTVGTQNMETVLTGHVTPLVERLLVQHYGRDAVRNFLDANRDAILEYLNPSEDVLEGEEV